MALFALRQHRFVFQVLSPVFFPPWKAENVVRGMFGLLLQEADDLLRPVWPNAPSGFATPPRPFLVRAHWLDGKRFTAGEQLHFDVIDFAPALHIGARCASACRRLETEGIGPGRGRLRLLTTETIEREFDLGAEEPFTEVTLDFVAPTEIDLQFNSLIASLFERINALGACYQGAAPLAPLPRATVELANDATAPVARERLSTRTGQRYETGGSVGRVQYRGPLDHAVPFLRAGEWTGVGGGAYVINW